MLTIFLSLGYFTDGDAVILVVSSYGRTMHPGWYHNLIANPECELFADGQWRTFAAAATEEDERARVYMHSRRATTPVTPPMHRTPMGFGRSR